MNAYDATWQLVYMLYKLDAVTWPTFEVFTDFPNHDIFLAYIEKHKA